MTIFIIIVSLALIFDYINGFHDAANSITNIVSTKVLSPFQAVIWAAFFNFLAFFIFKDHGVANTVAKTVVEQYINYHVILSGLIAAIIWNLLTWYYGIPSSSSHTLIGGFAGAAIAGTGFKAINAAVIVKTASFIVIAPLLGMFIAYIIAIWFLHSSTKGVFAKIFSIIVLAVAVLILVLNLKTHVDNAYSNHFLNIILFPKNFKWLLFAFILVVMSTFSLFLSRLNTFKAQKWFKRIQLVASAAFSIGHGGNDAQKVMGIIAVTFLFYQKSIGNNTLTVESILHDQIWIPFACYTAIGLGTMSGGWRIVKTMGTKITKITPFEGVAADTAGAVTLFLTEFLKIPVSTTHTITGSIMGAGATKRLSAVRWGVSVRLLWAWVLTIPVSAMIAMIVYYFSSLFV